jgi:UDP-4-amino-4,6-dideoxy-N-acetyl-beta-L-altrosamine transaminase
MIPYGRQDISQADIDSVVAVLKSDYLTQGPMVPRFEQAVAMYCGGMHAVAVNSATSALHIACLALGLGPGDILWTSPNTFVASANCALYCGGTVGFVDIDPLTYNMRVEALRKKLADAERNGCLPKIVVPVHFAGQSCEMREIKALSDRYGFRIIEDASHAIGGKYLDEHIGNGRYSDITIFSFHPVKIITTGEGGMALTNNSELAERMRLLRSHGITRDPGLMDQPSHGPWYYQQVGLGYNYRMTDIQAALGLSQLARIGGFIERRRILARNYVQLLRDLPVILPFERSDVQSAWHLYPVRTRAKVRSVVHAELHQVGILANVHYIPVHIQPYYQKLGFRVGDFPEAERYYEDAVSLPMFVGLNDTDQEFIAQQLRRILS